MKLRLAKDLALPLDAVTQKIAWLGRTGSGKTYGASKLAEEMIAANAQVVILDAVGVWYGLRLAADGKGKGIEIPVFGGLHGDVPLEVTGGALVADLIVDRGISVVLDVSQFESDAQKARFAHEWCDRFFFRKKAAPSAIHVFLEECQEFVPQNPEKGEERMLHAFQRLEKLGRNFGIGVSLISQRPQEVNKKALNQTECLFVFQMTGLGERKAIRDWITDKNLTDDIAEILPNLEVGTAHVWSPQWLKISETIRILEKRTFNASSTPTVGQRAAVRHLAPIDLVKIQKAMEATIERAKAEDPRELRRQIQELKAQLTKKSPYAAQPKKVEVPALKNSQITRLERAVERMRDSSAALLKAHSHQVDRLTQRMQVVVSEAGMLKDAVALTHGEWQKPQIHGASVMQPYIPQRLKDNAELSRRVERGKLPGGVLSATEIDFYKDKGIGAGERRLLIAIAQNEYGADRSQLTTLTGYKRSSRDKYLSRLMAAGLVATFTGGTLIATERGVAMLGDSFERLPTGDALRMHWLAKLPKGEADILRAISANWPDLVSRESINGYKRSSRDKYLGRLESRKLIRKAGPGLVAASDTLFDREGRNAQEGR